MDVDTAGGSAGTGVLDGDEGVGCWRVLVEEWVC